VPGNGEVRTRAIDDTGQRIYEALARGAPTDLLVDDVGLRGLLDSQSATRFAALRVGISARLGTHAVDFQPLREARYGGVCLQASRLEPAGSALGLRADGWVFDRALVMGLQPGGRRVASWVEGAFVYTREGFRALDLTRVEVPRWEHADLELAACDMEVGILHPRPVVVATD
jgi:hypothetical protein